MCGIAGQFRFSEGAIDRRVWGDLVDRAWRRGPDGRGVWTHGARVLLGARRLTVMDPRPEAALPMIDDATGSALTFNGEIYNTAELRSELRARGHAFSTSGDSEVVLQALSEWGIDAPGRLNGMFAFGYYDARSESLVLARDHVGIKPLYFVRRGGSVLFASELRQILSHPEAAGLEIDPAAVAMFLRLGYVPAPLCIASGVRMLEPGTWLRVRADGSEESGKWFEFRDRSRDDPIPSRQVGEAVHAAVRSAVRRQMSADVPVGAFLSGGIDAPLVTAVMSAESTEPVPAFSVAMEDASLDESEEAARFARDFGCEHHVRRMTSGDAESLVDDVFACMGEPLADEGLFPSVVVSRLARERVTVALSGEGGDELFWGYVPRQIEFLRESSEPRREPLGIRYLERFSEFTQVQFRECFPDVPFWPDEHPFYVFDSASSGDVGRALRSCEIDAYLPFILLKTDRASMFHSLEVRVPLLDREVIDTASRIAARDCVDLDAGIGKVPLRNALSRYSRSQKKKKMGFTAPMDAWVRGILSDPVRASLISLRGASGVGASRPALERLFARHLAGAENNGMALWRLHVLDRWMTENAPVGGWR